MADYQLAAGGSIIRTADGLMFPTDPTNMFYVAYEAWVAAGGVPDPYVAPAPPPITTVTPVQGRVALFNAGLLDAATAAVNAAGGAVVIWWEYATVWERSNSYLTAMGTAIGLTSAQIDQLFAAAALIN